MDAQDRSERSRTERDSGEPGGGAGREDRVGGSGVHPASGGDAPDDAEIRTQADWGEEPGEEGRGRSEVRHVPPQD